MNTKLELFKDIHNLTYSVLLKLKKSEKELLQKVLVDLLGSSPTKKNWKKVEKVFQDEGSDYKLYYSKIFLGSVKYKSDQDNNISIIFEPE